MDRATSPHTRAVALLAVVVAAPLVLLAGSMIGRDWTPIGDEAVLVVRVDDVGTSATPLTGAYSTRGWSHPGPVHYLVLAPVHRLSGGSAAALLVATGLLNATAAATAVLVAGRLGGRRLAAVAALTTAALLAGMGPEAWVTPWNPYAAMLPFVVLVLAAVAVTLGDRALLPLVVATGSIAVQLHVAYVPLTVAVLGGCVAAWWLAPLGGELAVRDAARAVLWSPASLVLGAALWAPVALDVLVGSRNPLDVAKHFAAGHDATVGARVGLGALADAVVPWGTWAGAEQEVVLANVIVGSPLPLLGVFGVLTVLCVLCVRLHLEQPAALLVVSLALLAGASAAAPRLEEPLLEYATVWMRPVGMFVWTAAAWGAGCVGARALRGTRLTLVRRAIPYAAVGLVALVGVAQPWLDAPLPRDIFIPTVAAVNADLDGVLDPDARLRVESLGDPFGEVVPAVIAHLVLEGHTVFTDDGDASDKWGEHRNWNGQPVDATLTVVVDRGVLGAEAPDPCPAGPAGAPAPTLAVDRDGLTSVERAELDGLSLAMIAGGALDEDAVDRQADLDARAVRVRVYRGSTPCAAVGA